MTVVGDNPIEAESEDKLGRAKQAGRLAEQILRMDASLGLVVGVLGPWGSGKTSFINLMRPEFEGKATVLEFNPWMFSGAEQLVEAFFVELSSQLRLKNDKFKATADLLEDYGETFSGLGWLPLVGPWIERSRVSAKALGKLLGRRKEGVSARRKALTAMLKSLDQPIVVVIDDIDRLSTDEIRDVFKLVRLTASFPNIVYLVAFDRKRVETALAESGVPGRDYLEKILQTAYDLPVVPDDVMLAQIGAAIAEGLDGIEDTGPFDEVAWPDIFMEVVRPLIKNMRDLRRYIMAIQGTVRDLDGQVALTDVLGLEAIRVFLPDVFGALPAAVEGLTSMREIGYGQQEDPRLKESVEKLLTEAGDKSQVVRDAVERLFPAGGRHLGGSNYTGPGFQQQWLTGRRVAHVTMLRAYLEKSTTAELSAFSDAEIAFGLLADAPALEAHLRSVDPARVEEVISNLEAYEDKFTSEQVVPAVTVLLNILPGLPERPRGMFDLETRMVVARVVYRLIRSLQDPDEIAKAVREILPQVRTLTSRFELITDVGYREGAGHKLVSEADAATFERGLRDDLRAASAEDLALEGDLLRLFYWAKRDRQEDEPDLSVPDDPRVTAALLKSAESESRSQSMGSRSVRRTKGLHWDTLVEVVGSEAVLAERLAASKAVDVEGHAERLELAERYLSGWRPDKNDD